MVIWALLGALVIGISLGLLGAGGSILTLPVLIFMLHRPEKLAIAESLLIVGLISLVGAIPYGARREIHWRSVLYFGLPGMFGAYLGASFSIYLSASVQLTLFALMMFAVAWVMLFGPFAIHGMISSSNSNWILAALGISVGLITGLIGIGGGFLIVPALLLFGHLPMTCAIGTSLAIIVINTSAGFIRQLITLNHLNMQISWYTIAIISIIGILGSLTGGFIAKKVPQIYLRQAFGFSIFLTGTYILIQQF